MSKPSKLVLSIAAAVLAVLVVLQLIGEGDKSQGLRSTAPSRSLESVGSSGSEAKDLPSAHAGPEFDRTAPLVESSPLAGSALLEGVYEGVVRDRAGEAIVDAALHFHRKDLGNWTESPPLATALSRADGSFSTAVP